MTVYHKGEIAMHRMLGVEATLREIGERVIRDHMPEPHQLFFQDLRSVHLAAVDHQGHPWAFMRSGNPGFIQCPDAETLTIRSVPMLGESESLALSSGDKISVVGLDFATRRRNRVNATILQADGDLLHLKVDQSYGNCPKYIHVREVRSKANADVPRAVEDREALSDADLELLQRADTLFIASRSDTLSDDPRAGVDINHRGGPPGFVFAVSDTCIGFPDYLGNNFNNTLGNIVLDDRIGLQIFDFATRSTLNIQGRAELVEMRVPDEPTYTGRGLRITIQRVTKSLGVLPTDYELTAVAPHIPKRGIRLEAGE